METRFQSIGITNRVKSGGPDGCKASSRSSFWSLNSIGLGFLQPFPVRYGSRSRLGASSASHRHNGRVRTLKGSLVIDHSWRLRSGAAVPVAGDEARARCNPAGLRSASVTLASIGPNQSADCFFIPAQGGRGMRGGADGAGRAAEASDNRGSLV